MSARAKTARIEYKPAASKAKQKADRKLAWGAWLEENKSRFPDDKVEFVKSIYMDGYSDGYGDADSSRLFEAIRKLEKDLGLK